MAAEQRIARRDPIGAERALALKASLHPHPLVRPADSERVRETIDPALRGGSDDYAIEHRIVMGALTNALSLACAAAVVISRFSRP